MQDSKLYQTLKIFTKEEFDLLRQVLNSSVFNSSTQSEDVYGLFYILKSHIETAREVLIFDSNKVSELGSGTEGGVLEKASVFKMLFPDLNFNERENKLDIVMSGLNKVVEKFISFKKYCIDNPDIYNELALAEFFRTRNLDNETRLKIKHLNSDASLKIRQKDSFIDYLSTLEEYKYQVQQNTSTSTPYLIKSIKSLDYHYIVTRLSHTLSMLVFHHQHVPLAGINVESYFSMIEDLDSLIRKNGFENQPIILLYFKAFKLIENKVSDAEINDFKYKIDEYGHFLDPQNLKYIRTVLRNYYARQYNKGDNTFLPILHELYINDFNNKTLFSEKEVRPLTALTFINICIKQNDFDGIEKFLNTYTVEPIDYHQFIKALYFFGKKEYKTSYDIFLGINERLNELNYQLAARILEIKLCYELDIETLFIARTEAFKIYLFTNKNEENKTKNNEKSAISEIFTKKYSKLKVLLTPHKWKLLNNFNNAIIQINGTSNFDINKLQSIENKIKTKKAYAEREWLLDKIKEKLKKHTKVKK